jgi:hypothetical protein
VQRTGEIARARFTDMWVLLRGLHGGRNFTVEHEPSASQLDNKIPPMLANER